MIAAAENEAPVDLLVETDSKILDMVQRELGQEYLRLVTRSMRAGAQKGASDPTLPASRRDTGKS